MVNERLFISKRYLERIENNYIKSRHVERYAVVRQYCYGVVADIACGSGYGSFLISKNPDVKKVIGIDSDKKIIKFAKRKYKKNNVEFHCMDMEDYGNQIDTLVSVETIEHLQEKEKLHNLARRVNAKRIIITFTTKKTTHYNPYHLWDFTFDDIHNIFFGMYSKIYKQFEVWNEVGVIVYDI